MKFQIITAATPSYAGPLHVMLSSVKERGVHEGDMVSCWILHNEEFPPASRRLVEEIAASDFRIQWLLMDAKLVDGLPIYGHAGIATYFRLFMDQIPESLGTVIYLDADILVVDRLSKLIAACSSEALVNAVQEADRVVSSPRAVFDWQNLALDPNAPYFNAGVLVFDRERWIKEGVLQRAIAYLRQHQKKVFFWDQGGLNAILAGEVHLLPPRWNITTDVLKKETWNDRSAFSRVVPDAINAPGILHFTGGGKYKPWEPFSTHPAARLYRSWMTVGRDYFPTGGGDNSLFSVTPLKSLAKRIKKFGGMRFSMPSH